jgi:hypothetical protein
MYIPKNVVLKSAATIGALAMITLAPSLAAQHKPGDVPVDFSASAQGVGALGAVATTLKIHVDRYTADRDRTSLVAALKRDGYQAFLPAFRKVPVIGYVQIKDQKWNLRWASQQTRDVGQTVMVATDQPMFFLGGAGVNPKPRAGYELAVIRLELDTIGMGSGTLAAAARVKPNADATGVEIDDYAEEPLKLTSVTRVF